jgi:hypothetical protein
MATFIAEIDTYSVLLAHGNSQSQSPFRNRFIHLHFKDNTGKLEFYSLSFVPEAKHASTGTMEKRSTGGFYGNTNIPMDEFSLYYEVLCREKQVSVRLDFDDDPDASPVGEPLPLKSFTLFTGNEPID